MNLLRGVGNVTVEGIRASTLFYARLGEESGVRVDSASGYDLTDNNTVGSDTGKVGSLAADFVAANSEYLSRATMLPVFAGWDGTQPYSVSFWQKLTNTGLCNIVTTASFGAAGVGFQIQGTYGGSAGSIWWSPHVEPAAGAGMYRITTYTTAGGYFDGTWRHIVCTYDGSYTNAGCMIYVNGSSVATTAYGNELGSPTDWEDGYFMVGNASTYPAPVNGEMEQLGIFDRVLTSGEVGLLYNDGAGVELI